MTRLGVVGGRLQGTEAAYLGAAAGYEVVVIDRSADTPAGGLAAESHVFDVVAQERRAREVLATCDVVMPACENEQTLVALEAMLSTLGVPFAFHMPSYRITSSKIASDRLFAELDVPRPLPWPECGYPVVVKPSAASGSAGVSVAHDEREWTEARAALESVGHEVVTQQFVDGPSLSLEVIRTEAGSVTTFLPTGLEFDRDFDCKRVTAPADGSPRLLQTLAEVSSRLAEAVGLVGLMDVEVMVDGDVPRVIEIDARFPSQTPTAVFHASGVNLLEALVDSFTGGTPRMQSRHRGVCYQHVSASAGTLAVLGEHVMAGARPLRRVRDVFGADEVLTDRAPGAASWVATMICVGRDESEAREKAHSATLALAEDAGLTLLPEGGPAALGGGR